MEIWIGMLESFWALKFDHMAFFGGFLEIGFFGGLENQCHFLGSLKICTMFWVMKIQDTIPNDRLIKFPDSDSN